jgi:hypothetical protein
METGLNDPADNFLLIGLISVVLYVLFLVYAFWRLWLTISHDKFGRRTNKLLQWALIGFACCEIINGISLIVEDG